MPHYLIQVSYAAQATKALVENPQTRREVVAKTCESVGGRMHSLFFCFGEYDVALLAEFPNNEAAAAVALATSSSGALSKYRTTPLLTPEEAMSAMTLAQKASYTPPA
ncbi:GYD domain-containing protein [Inquilinus sp. OTU3971]|uniref:GYD domain-containing protein n=1 Tax=Inquilinus sp. OTU3971 TaxID=3043855 RepID=UPI00313B533C